jgi:hypothetical protein
MKLYSSFLIRCWLIRDSPVEERFVIDVEHIQTGGHQRAASLLEVETWMMEACRTVPLAADAARTGGRKLNSGQ